MNFLKCILASTSYIKHWHMILALLHKIELHVKFQSINRYTYSNFLLTKTPSFLRIKNTNHIMQHTYVRMYIDTYINLFMHQGCHDIKIVMSYVMEKQVTIQACWFHSILYVYNQHIIILTKCFYSMSNPLVMCNNINNVIIVVQRSIIVI